MTLKIAFELKIGATAVTMVIAFVQFLKSLV